MPVQHLPGTLSANKYAGSPTQAYDASKVTSGTFAAARSPKLTIGTAPARALNTLVAAPTVPRFVSVAMNMAPTIGGESTADLTQRGQGTIGMARRGATGPINADLVQGWVLPNQGSYQVRTTGGGNLPTIVEWSEFNCR